MQNGHQIHPTIIELRRYLIDSLTNTVKTQRLNAMKYGTPLQISANRSLRKDSQRLMIALSLDQHSLIARDAEKCYVQSWPINSIKAVYPGSEEKRIRQTETTIVLAFRQEDDAELNEAPFNTYASIRERFSTSNRGREYRITLLAGSELSYTNWMDGFWILGKYAHESVRFAEDLKNLVELELRIRMFGLLGTPLPGSSVPDLMPHPDLSDLPLESERQ